MLNSRGEEDDEKKREKLKKTAVCGAKAMPKCLNFKATAFPMSEAKAKPKPAKATSAEDVIAVSAGVVIDVSDEVEDVSGCQTKEEWEWNREVEYIQKRRAEFEQGMEMLKQQPGFEQAQEKLKQQRKKLAPLGETLEERDERELQEDWEHHWKIAAEKAAAEEPEEKPKASGSSSSN